MKVKTRFAPSPTGYMHVGSLRTALFAYIYAKQNDGVFILRIEDTDKAREVEGSIGHIQEVLKWLNLNWDEGPYLQSERLDIYRQWAQKLIDKGLAYTDSYTKEEVDEFREKSKAEKKAFLFRDYRPEQTGVENNWYGRLPLRLKIADVQPTDWHDVVWGKMHAGAEALDDFVLIKADGFPTYNFAHVVDDQLMEITHVIRGEEFLASVPKFIALHKALEVELPVFATMPPILGPGGNKKLSKRDGAKDVLEYRDEGYLVEAVFNFIASLGWNDGTEQEIYTPDEIMKTFDLSRIQKSGAQFDIQKLDWVNWQHVKKLVEDDHEQAISYLKEFHGFDGQASPEILALTLTKSNSPDDLVGQLQIFNKKPDFNIQSFDLESIDSDLTKTLATKYISGAIESLADLKDFDSQAIEVALRSRMSDLKAQPRAFLNLVRWAISGQSVSPNLFEMITLMGKEEVSQRLQSAVS